MRIGSLIIENNTVLAPLAGITNLPFRLIAKKGGCGLVCSEMISSNGLVFGAKKTLRMLESFSEEKPVSFQIFGSDPSVMAEAARIVESSGADILDINFGCSVKKIVKSGAGVVLMKDPVRAEAILKAVRNSIKIPLTIKMRTGWEKTGEDAVVIAKIAEACGVDAVAVHPRTANQGFRGKADWSVISKVRKSVSIPVIGNGDIIVAEDAVDMISQTGCNAVMIGRSAIGNPWIFSQVKAILEGKPVQPVSIVRRFEAMREYLKVTVEYLGEKQACFMMRSRLGWFVKGLASSSRFRESIKQISSEHEAQELIGLYLDFVCNRIEPAVPDTENIQFCSSTSKAIIKAYVRGL
ncbi:MAG: tRNA dihydrouridine synthase DusB [Proteobacteria bacterium]|nr:tRNA dihydrouridine synthase DusB [Pseudomonadota bacterium]MBU1568931.1 tRNA dihydrouridine synthase DusB [Pseudomonadota bacterium]